MQLSLDPEALAAFDDAQQRRGVLTARTRDKNALDTIIPRRLSPALEHV